MEQEKHPHLKQPIILVFIEESNELAESLKLRFTEPLKKIIKVCRKYGIYFINAGPSFKATTYDSDIIDCCTSKVVFGDFDSDTARVFNLGSLRLSEVVPGRGIFKVAGRAQEFQSLYLEEQTFMAVVNMLRQKAGIEVMDTSPDLAAIRSHLESSEFANSPFGIVSKEAGGAKETSPEQSIPPLGTKFHSETGVELGTFEAGTKFQVELSSNQSGTKFQPEWNSPPKSGTRLELMEQVPTQVELSSSPNEKFHAQNSENDESSSSTAITEVKLTHPQIAQIVAMLVDGKWNKTEMIKVIADLSKVHRGRNYKLLADYYEQLVASLGDWGGGGANSGELTLAKRKTQPVVGEIETRITAGATDPSFAPNTADAEKPLIQVTASPQVSSKESQQYQQPTVTLSNAVVSGVTTLNRPGPGSGTNTQGQDFTKATEALSPMIFPSTPLGAAETKEIAIPLGTASLTGLTLYIYQAMQASDPEYGFSLEELQSKLKDAYNLLIPLDTIGAKLNILMGLNKVEAEYDEESYETYYYLS